MSLRKTSVKILSNRHSQLAVTFGVFGLAGFGIHEALDADMNTSATEESSAKTAEYSSRIQNLSEQTDDYELAKTLVETAVNGGDTEKVVEYTAKVAAMQNQMVEAGTTIAFDILNDNTLTETDYATLAEEFNYLERQEFTEVELPDAENAIFFDEAREAHPVSDKVEPWVRAKRIGETMEADRYDNTGGSFYVFMGLYLLVLGGYVSGATERVGNNLARRLSQKTTKPKH